MYNINMHSWPSGNLAQPTLGPPWLHPTLAIQYVHTGLANAMIGMEHFVFDMGTSNFTEAVSVSLLWIYPCTGEAHHTCFHN